MRKPIQVVLMVGLWCGAAVLWWYYWPSVYQSYAHINKDKFNKTIEKIHKKMWLVTFTPSKYPSKWKGTPTKSPFACQGVKPVSGRPKLMFKVVTKGFRELTDLAFAPGDSKRLFVLEQNYGRIWIVKDGKRLPKPFLTMSNKLSVGGERGLLGLAFHPKYEKNRKFYVYFTERKKGDVIVAEYQTSKNPDRALSASFRQILRITQPEGNHNGGALRFGPDGYLYIGVGDGGSGSDPHGPIGSGQDSQTWLGKILRIDINRKSGKKAYAIPSDNPFVKNPKFLPEVAFWGLRNPWRITFDKLTGDLWIGDVGQNLAEEISFAPKGVLGLNFGWRCKEGLLPHINDKHCASKKLVKPIAHLKQHVRPASFCSVMQGYHYRGCKMPGYHGTVFYSDYCIDHIRSFRWNGTKASHDEKVQAQKIYRITSFAQDHQGELYLSTGTGYVVKLIPRPKK